MLFQVHRLTKSCPFLSGENDIEMNENEVGGRGRHSADPSLKESILTLSRAQLTRQAKQRKENIGHKGTTASE